MPNIITHVRVWVNRELHERVAHEAARRGLSARLYIAAAITEKLEQDEPAEVREPSDG